MSEWITQSIDLISSACEFLLSEPVFYIACLFVLIAACRLFKRIGG